METHAPSLTELPISTMGYPAGTLLRNVTIQEARAYECNRCGDCCNGLRENVAKDEATGLPLTTWGSKFPADLYRERYGEQMLIPIIMGDGGPTLGDAFEVDADGKPYTCFACAFLNESPEDGAETACKLIAKYGQGDPADISTIRPRACGEFPVFGLDVDATIIDGHPYVPPTGNLPRCVWHGIRITGPWKRSAYWQERWEKQQRGESVDAIPTATHPALAAWIRGLEAQT